MVDENMSKNKARRSATSVMVFHQLLTRTMSSQVSQLPGTPSGFAARFLQEADAWTLFRFRSLRFRIFGGTSHTAAGDLACCGVQEGAPDTPAATEATVLELIPSIAHAGAGQTVWSEWVQVPSSVLAGQMPWYQTVLGTFPAVAEVPFTFCFFGTSTGVIKFEVRYTVEFKSQAAAGNTPQSILLAERLREEREAQRVAKERGRLLEVLALPGLKAVPSALNKMGP